MTTTIQKNLPPSLPTSLLGGHFPQFRRRPIEFLTASGKLGDVSFVNMGGYPLYFFNHPDLVRDVFVSNHSGFHKGRALQRMKGVLGKGLLTSEEEFHLRQRRMIQPAFHRQRIAGYAAAMVELGERMANSWRAGETVDVHDEVMRLTLAIVAKTLFNADVDDEADEVGEALTTMVSMFNLLLMPFSEILEKLPLPHVRKFNRAKATVDRVIFNIIAERRKSNQDYGDLLSMLLVAQDENDGGQMTDEQVRDECLTLFLAGHETTAVALVWTWYLLAQHPEIEQQLHQELDRVLPNKRLPTFEDYAELKFTEAVLAESMRLYPPVWAIGRLASKPQTIGNYTLSEKSLVLVSPYTIHHDERFWNDAEKFKPERWLNEMSIKEASQKFIYIPFGGGVRRCIGEQFAWTEGVLLLAAIARKWKLELVLNQKIELHPLITLRPKHGMRMTVKEK